MNSPVISVIMPVYNGENHLKEAIESILNQSFVDFEFIILNDGSTDKTEEVILSYNDPRIIYIKNETNLKIVKTLNKGIELAKGKYIARMDADDISLPERFEKQVEFMEENPDIDVCGSYVKTIDLKPPQYWKYPITSENIKIALLFFSPLAHPSVIIKKSFFSSQKYNINYQKAEDYYLWASSSQQYKFANIPEFLLCYRIHENQTSTKHEVEQLELSNKIRIDLLREFGIAPIKSETEIHEKISCYRNIDMVQAEMWLHKLYQQNKKNSKFDQEAFKKFIDNKWWEIANKSAYKGMNTYFYYYQSKRIKFYRKSFLKNIKFFIKCLIKYS